MPTKEMSAEITVTPLRRGMTKLRIIGVTPLFQNRMANKAKQELLVGGRKKNKAERANIKHDPFAEYRNSAEILPDGPTALGLRVVAVKAAMADAALKRQDCQRHPRSVSCSCRETSCLSMERRDCGWMLFGRLISTEPQIFAQGPSCLSGVQN